MMRTAIAILPLAAALALGACKKSDDQPKAAAGGELLERSVSDDMLPYDTVQSQASLAAPDDGLLVPRSSRPSADVPAEPVTDDAEDAAPVDEAPLIEDAPPPPTAP